MTESFISGGGDRLKKSCTRERAREEEEILSTVHVLCIQYFPAVRE